MKTWHELSIHEKLKIKQHAMNTFGKRWHTPRPDFCNNLDELAINWVLSLPNSSPNMMITHNFYIGRNEM